jgi:sialidase-1
MTVQSLARRVLIVLAAATCVQAEEPTHVFLLVGQSNMAGRAAIEDADRSAIDGASLWDIGEKTWKPAVAPFNLYSPHRKSASMQRLNCGPAFVREYLRTHPGVKVGIVCAARGGTSIEEWKKGRTQPWPLYDTAVNATRDALAGGDAELKGILWHQGEGNSSRWDFYPAKLKDLIANFRADLGAPKVPFVFSQLGTWRREYRAFNQMIVQQPQYIPHTLCVRTAGLSRIDQAHFDAEAQRELGRRYAKAIERLSSSTVPFLATNSQTFSSTYSVPRGVQSGRFELSADITLEKLEGTAASVWFGNQLNFGFDSRSGKLFVEGPAVGKSPKHLANTRDFISAGLAFQFSAIRDENGELTISLNRKPVFKTNKLTGLPLMFRFRPHRNTMSVANLSLAGDLTVPPVQLAIESPIVPVLIGKETTVARLSLQATKRMRLVGARVSTDGTSSLANIESLSLVAAAAGRIELLGSDARKQIQTTIDLQTGLHTLQLIAKIKGSASLQNSIRTQLLSLIFTDGKGARFEIKPDEGHEVHVLRLAAPIHRQGDFDCHTTRIPGIARTPQGTLLAVYDLRYNSRKDLQEHIDIGLSRSTDNGKTWEQPRPIMDMGEFGGKPQKENGCSDPNILVDANTGEIFVSAVWTHGKPNTHQWVGRGSEPGFGLNQSSQFMIVRSTDDGKTWSKPTNVTRQLKDEAWWLFAPAPGNGITLRDGTLVMPTQGRDENGHPFSNLMHSRDHGQTWTLSVPARDNTTECSVAELSDGSLMLNMRDNRNRNDKSRKNGRAISVTDDLGKTWTLHKTDHGALREPVCMASLISHTRQNGQHVLVFSNPNSKTSRKRMTVQFSFDDGATWPREHHVLLDERGGAYSSLVMLDDDTVGILYESSQANLVYQTVPVPTPPVKEPKPANKEPRSDKANSNAALSRIMFGSCIKQQNPVPIFKTIVEQKPDLFLFVGDNIYADTNDLRVMRDKYGQLNSLAGFRRLRESTSVLATWDDHDYGRNDAGVEYALKAQSQREFLRFWQEPKDSPLWRRPGIYKSQMFGPEGKRVQVILLDTRYFRSELKRGQKRVGGAWVPDSDPKKTMLGAAQWEWLEAELRKPAELRIVVSSIQAVAQDAGQETWSNLPAERSRLFRLIDDTGADGVIFISGDRHWSELSSTGSATSYPLYDLTSSSLNQTHGRGTPTRNRFRVSDTTYHKANFGAVLIDWKLQPSVTLQIIDESGEVRIERSVPLGNLAASRR